MPDYLLDRLTSLFSRTLSSLSIRRKLLYAFLLVATIPLLCAGGFAFGLVVWLTDNNAGAAIQDKTHIASLLLDDQKRQLEAVSQAMANDNLVRINLGLGLLPPIDTYLANTRKRTGLAFTLLLDAGGRVLSSGNQPAGIRDNVSFLPPDVLAGIPAGQTRVWAMRLGASPFAAQEGLVLPETWRELSLVAVAPVADQNLGAVNWVVAGLMLGLPDNPGSLRFMGVLKDNLGVPVVVTDTGRILLSSEPLPEIALPDGFANGLAAATASTGNSTCTAGLSSWLTQYLPLRGYDGKPVGAIGILYPQLALIQTRILSATILVVALALAFVAALLVAFGLSHLISRPIVAVAEGAKSIVKGNWNIRIPVTSTDEIGEMAEEFTVMTVQLKSLFDELNHEVSAHEAAEAEVRRLNSSLELKVAQRTQELSDSNEALAESLEVLRKTQKHLVQSEKMASLGNLVAGVAHELNTPIGSCLTVSTFAETRSQEFTERFLQGGLTKREFEEFLLLVSDSSRLITSNLHKAADQIRFFKQIAVDQDNELPTEISLGKFLDELLASLGAAFRRPGFHYRTQVGSEVLITTYAGSLYQVLHKVIQNSWQHGFAGRDSGTITLSAQTQGSRVCLTLEDDGVGIAEDHLQRIFDPFFTTARSAGSTGLGLSIVYNLVTSRLGGTITCESTPGRRTCFTIELPKKWVANTANRV